MAVLRAEAAIRAGFDHALGTGERYQDSDLHRLRAECLRRAGRVDEAATALHAAIRIAATQHARTAELRAAIDAVRLHQATGRMRNAARRLAAAVAALGSRAQLADLAVADALLRGRDAPLPARKSVAAAAD